MLVHTLEVENPPLWAVLRHHVAVRTGAFGSQTDDMDCKVLTML
jgi:hypothetical protein